MRYYDSTGSRRQRVQETMSSMGSSIFLGASSTFLGVLCLSFSTSDILQDIFKAVVGLIVFGVLNGLIFLPVTLARIGPEPKSADSQSVSQPSDSSETEQHELKTREREPLTPTGSPHSKGSFGEYTA